VSRPVRTCIGCRVRADKADLLRIVWNQGPCADPTQTAPGRGGYLHRDPGCLDQAIKRRSLSRALRLGDGGQAVDPMALRQAVEPLISPVA
jgi:predicted RNA-binding protein YlxR (DUF448 family)